MRESLSTFVVALALAGGGAAQIQGGYYVNEALGFKVKVPSRWTQVPIQIDESWIVAKFLSNKTWISKSRDWNWEHKPLMTITVFTDEAKKFEPYKTEKRGNSIFVSTGSLPYRDYQDYLKRNLQSGYYFDKEEQDEVSGVPCLQYEVRQHKTEVKRRLIAWVFRRDDMDVAVEFEVLEDRLDRLRRTCESSLRSFRFIERSDVKQATDAAARSDLNSDLWTKFRSEWRKLSIKERIDKRVAIERARFAAIRSNTPPDWEIGDSRHFLVLSHADRRYAERAEDAAEAFRAWCDKHFSDLSDEYVRKGVLRVCKDYDEYRAYHKVSGETWTFQIDDDREVVTYRDGYSGTSGRDMGFIFSTILDLYIQDKDPLMFQYTPAWLRTGMYNYVSNAIMKGKKLDFRPDDWEREDMNELEREDKLLTLRELMTLDEDEYWKTLNRDRRVQSQLTNAFRFILGPGRRQAPLKDFINRYMKAVIEVAEEHKAKWDKEVTAYDEAETEEEEEARAKASNDRSRKRRSEIAKDLEKRMLGFSDSEWRRLEKAYDRFVGR